MKHIPSIQERSSQPLKLAALRQAHQDWNTTSDVLTRLTRRLATTLSLEEQLAILAEELNEIVPFGTMNYRHRIGYQDFVYATGMGGPHRCEYRLALEGVSYGTLVLQRRHRFTEQELEGIEILLGAAICPIRNACKYAAIEQASLTDSLTGVPNKRALDDALRQAGQLSERHGQPYSLILCDLDHFKSVNDTHGHVVGDHLLQVAATELERSVRTSDSVYRFGGEEFAILLPHTDDLAAREVAERIREAIATIRVDTGEKELQVTTSCGVATCLPGESTQAWVARADAALYQAKSHGRNCTRLFASIS